MLDLSYDPNDSIKSKNKKNSTQFFLNNGKNSPKTKLRNTLLKSPIRNRSIRVVKSDDDEEDSEKEEEDEKTKLLRLRQERTDFLIKLLTESPRESTKKKKLKPLNQSKFSLDKSINSTNRSNILTEPNQISKSLPKFYSLKEKRKWERKLKKEKERREKEKERKENQKIMKEIKILRKAKNREIFRSNLNRLYGYNNRFLFYNAKLKKEKWNNLEKYQEDILRVSSINLSKDNMLKLFSDLKTIRINSEQAKPLPPINFKALVHHSLDENNTKKKFGIRAQNKKFSQMDEYEKEMFMIKTNSRHEKLNNSSNKLLYKMYEILPEHVVDSVYGKKRKF